MFLKAFVIQWTLRYIATDFGNLFNTCSLMFLNSDFSNDVLNRFKSAK